MMSSGDTTRPEQCEIDQTVFSVDSSGGSDDVSQGIECSRLSSETEGVHRRQESSGERWSHGAGTGLSGAYVTLDKT